MCILTIIYDHIYICTLQFYVCTYLSMYIMLSMSMLICQCSHSVLHGSDSRYPVDCSPPGSSAHGVSQARRLEQLAISFSTESPSQGLNLLLHWQPGSLPLSPWKALSMLLLALQQLPFGSHGEESACNPGDLGSIPGLGRSPGEGHGSPLQYSSLENPHGQRSLAGLQRVRHD